MIEGDWSVCYLCRESAEVAECPQCGNVGFASEMQDFSDLLDSDYDEGQAHIYNDYGYTSYVACPDCIGKVRDDIENKRAEEYYQMMEEEEEWHRRRGTPNK